VLSKCDLEILLDRPDRAYRPGATIRGMVGVTVNKDCTCNGLTLTREWRTHGRGNRSRGGKEADVLFEGEWKAGEQHVHPFEIEVPDGPLTYHGHHLNVDWYLDARADIPWALDPKASEEFVVLPGQRPPRHRGPLFVPGRHNTGQGVAGAVFGMAFAGFGSVFLFGMSCVLCSGEVGGSDALFMLPFFLIPLVFVAVGVGIAFSSVRNRLAARRLGEVEVSLTPEVVTGGEVVQVEVRFTPRASFTLHGATAELKAREEVVSGSGTNKRTHTHGIFERTRVLCEQRELEAGHPVVLQGELQIPRDPAPSFAASSNRLDWKVKILLDAPGWSDWSEEHLVGVSP
jgi:hypothetical protein